MLSCCDFFLEVPRLFFRLRLQFPESSWMCFELILGTCLSLFWALVASLGIEWNFSFPFEPLGQYRGQCRRAPFCAPTTVHECLENIVQGVIHCIQDCCSHMPRQHIFRLSGCLHHSVLSGHLSGLVFSSAPPALAWSGPDGFRLGPRGFVDSLRWRS